MAASLLPSSGRLSWVLIPWLCCGASVGFLLWILLNGPAELQQVSVGLRSYLLLLPTGLAAAGVVCAVLWFAGIWGIAARLSYSSCIFYFGFAKVLGWAFVPWVLVVAAVIGFSYTKKRSIEIRWSLLLLHAMGTLTGLYMAFHLNGFLRPWGLFMETTRSLWLLLINLMSR
jgi:hypothetical protein